MMPTLKYVTGAYVSVRYSTAKPYWSLLIHFTLHVYATYHLLRRLSYWLLIGPNILHIVSAKSLSMYPLSAACGISDGSST